MFGQNPVRKQDLTSPGILAVQEIFKTIQGEGPLAGTPAIFIRLAGCNLRCHFCDTEFESGMENRIPVHVMRDQIRNIKGDSGIKLAVITGGEPMRQNLHALLANLFNVQGLEHVQIETAGVIWIPKLETWLKTGQLSIVCSPKTPGIHIEMLEYCHDWKYIVAAGQCSEEDGLPIYSTQSRGLKQTLFRPALFQGDSVDQKHQIWIQPMDDGENTQANIQEAIRICLKFGYRLSYQLHKTLNLP